MALTISASEVLAFNPDLDEQVVNLLIRDGLAMARRVAPCIDEDGFEHVDAAVAVIRSAVLRWAESGSGGVSSTQNTAGPFSSTVSFDNRTTRRSLFYPSEIRELEGLCSGRRGKVLGMVDTIPTAPPVCPPACSYLVGSCNQPCGRCGRLVAPGGGSPW